MRRHLRSRDVYVHADLPNAPVCVVKQHHPRAILGKHHPPAEHSPSSLIRQEGSGAYVLSACIRPLPYIGKPAPVELD